MLKEELLWRWLCVVLRPTAWALKTFALPLINWAFKLGPKHWGFQTQSGDKEHHEYEKHWVQNTKRNCSNSISCGKGDSVECECD